MSIRPCPTPSGAARRARPAAALALALAALGQAPARAQTDPAPAPAPPPAAEPGAPARATLERVEIRRGPPSDSQQRQQSTAARTVIGREEIERMGDGNVAEVLRRLPGVTIGGGRPGRGGAVRMRGLGAGYTQILINGERMPMGMSLDALTPDQVERIEITRGPTAETGAQAIAGTINIVLREDVRQRLNQVHLRLGHDDGHWQPSASLSRAEQLDAFGYNLSAHAMDSRSEDTTLTRTVETANADGRTTLDQDRLQTERSRRRAVHLGGRMQWRLGAGESFALMPFFMHSESHRDGAQRLDARVGAPDFADAATGGTGRYTMGRLNAQWQTRLDGGLRLELKAGGSRADSASTGLRDERDAAGTLLRHIEDRRDGRDRWLSTGGKVSRPMDDGAHLLSLGWEVEQGRRDETRDTTETAADGTVRALAGEFGDTLQARTLRTALWAQDEWSVTPRWSLQGGLRWEAIDTRSDALGGADAIARRASVLTPLLHAVFRPEEGGPDQIRASLTRSYRAPTLMQLIGRRTLATGTNLETNPDRAGNPDLRPELATGLDLAWEHHLREGGVLSVGVFDRRITDLIRDAVAQETVGGETRWVSRPTNIGGARTRGLELEAKFRLREVLDADPATLPAVELRANASVFRSRVDGVPGPDNRLDRQPDWTAALGADWKPRGWPLTLGATVSRTPGHAIQLSDRRRATVDLRRMVDAYALWSFSPTVQLRMSASNLAARDEVGTSTVQGADTRQVAATTTRSATAWALRLELKL